MSIGYQNKINERLIGLAIASESHVIGVTGIATLTPGLVRLVEVPQAPSPLSTVSIPGYTEIIIGSPTGTQFLVDYLTGVITFNVSQDGNIILVSYIGLGSEIAAEDINELQGPVGIALNYNGSLSNNIVKPASISNTTTDDFIFPRDVTANRDLIVTTKVATDEIKSRTGNLLLEPFSNSVTGIKLANATGTVILNVDTTNNRVGINTSAPTSELQVLGTIVGYKDNATCLRVSGLDFGSNPVQSYSGVFYDVNYDALGLKQTRFITGSNTEMDLELQTDNALLLDAMNGTNTGIIKLSSSTSINVNSRNTPDRNAEKYLIIDRVDTSTFGTSNTSDVNLTVNTGNLSLLNDQPTSQINAPKLILTNTVVDTDALTINNTTPYHGIFCNGKIIGHRDNGSSLAVSGLQDPSEGIATVNSYSGIFYDSGYNTTGTLKTRFITGGNLEMDVELQSPHQLRLIAGDNTTVDANVYMVSNTIIGLHARSEQEAVDAHYLVVDRVDTSTRGLLNTSEMVLATNSGSLHLNYGITNGAVGFPSLSTTQKQALSVLTEGMVIYDITLHKLCVYTSQAGGSGTGWETVTSVLE